MVWYLKQLTIELKNKILYYLKSRLFLQSNTFFINFEKI